MSDASNRKRGSEDAKADPGAREAASLMGHHRGIALGATLAIVGLGLVGTHPRQLGAQGPAQSDVGAFVVLAGLLVLFYRIHRYGRLGPAGVARPKRPRKATR
ncbi:MAG: hypothetical protein RIF41_29145 [Polyangiaceae bacterium]